MCGGAQRVKVGGLAPYYRLSLAEVKRLLGGAPLLSVTLAGGYAEPFLNKEIFRIAEFIRSQGGETRAVTNGTLIGRDFAKRIVEAGFSDLWVSIHGATPEVAQYVMEGSQFDVVIQNLKDLQECKARARTPHPRVHLIFVGMKSNIHELEGVVRLVKQVGALDVAVKPMGIPPPSYHLETTWWESEDLVKHPELLATHYLKAKQTARELGVKLETVALFDQIATDFQNQIAADEAATPTTTGASQVGRPEAGSGEQSVPGLTQGQAKKTKNYEEIGPPGPGETRFCMFPFNKPTLNRWDVTPCCSKSTSKVKVIMGKLGPDGILPIWDNQAYRDLRTAILTGEKMPDYCKVCERAPIVPKEVMILQTALFLHVERRQEEPFHIICQFLRFYDLYVEHMRKLSIEPIPLPRVLEITFQGYQAAIRQVAALEDSPQL
jgi:hypothetical protein